MSLLEGSLWACPHSLPPLSKGGGMHGLVRFTNTVREVGPQLVNEKSGFKVGPSLGMTPVYFFSLRHSR